MAEAMKWRESVTVVRAASLETVMRGPSGAGRATAFDFAGVGGERTWIGTVRLGPGAKTGAHHHGRHEVALYVIRGRSEIRWGERLEFAPTWPSVISFTSHRMCRTRNATRATASLSTFSSCAATTNGLPSLSTLCPSHNRKACFNTTVS
jgi:hypothetical protein